MSIKPLTDRQQTLIVNNVIAATKDITKLSRNGYKYLYLCSGFIAHYNQYGFIEYYKTHSLYNDLVQNMNANMWKNFRQGDQNYDYYMSKALVYNKILSKLTQC